MTSWAARRSFGAISMLPVALPSKNAVVGRLRRRSEIRSEYLRKMSAPRRRLFVCNAAYMAILPTMMVPSVMNLEYDRAPQVSRSRVVVTCNSGCGGVNPGLDDAPLIRSDRPVLRTDMVRSNQVMSSADNAAAMDAG